MRLPFVGIFPSRAPYYANSIDYSIRHRIMDRMNNGADMSITRTLALGRVAGGNHLVADCDEPELHPVFAGLLAPFSPAGQETIRRAQRTAYEQALAAHDWEFEMSDDHSVYQRGRDSFTKLRMIRRDLDPDWSIWNSVAPDEHKVRPL